VRTQEDLDALFTALDIVYFDGELRSRGIKIVWRKFRKGKKSFVYARHYLEDKLIVVNQHLARSDVPAHVLMATIFHEQLHAVTGPNHDHAFQLAEMRYVHHAAASVWENEHDSWLRSL
jgi:hypothetical protein